MTRCVLARLVGFAICCLLSLRALGDDWPRWRGPNSSGSLPDSTPFKTDWSQGGPTLRWRAAYAGTYSSIDCTGGKAYVVSGNASGDKLVCLDADTGNTLWESPSLHNQYSAGEACATPCVWNGKIYCVMSSGPSMLFCVNDNDGSIRWSVNLGVPDVYASPLVAGGVVVCAAGTLRGYDPDTGAQLWTGHDTDNGPGARGVCSSPATWTCSSDGKEYVIYNKVGEQVCTDPADGSVVWTVNGGGTYATPAIWGDYEFLNGQCW